MKAQHKKVKKKLIFKLNIKIKESLQNQQQDRIKILYKKKQLQEEKLEELIKEKQLLELDQCTFKPTLNSNFNQLNEYYETNIYERLYNQKQTLQEKLDLQSQIE